MQSARFNFPDQKSLGCWPKEKQKETVRTEHPDSSWGRNFLFSFVMWFVLTNLLDHKAQVFFKTVEDLCVAGFGRPDSTHFCPFGLSALAVNTVNEVAWLVAFGFCCHGFLLLFGLMTGSRTQTCIVQGKRKNLTREEVRLNAVQRGRGNFLL